VLNLSIFMGVKHGFLAGNNHIEQYIFVPKRNKVTHLEYFSTTYLINLCKYKLLLEGHCRIDMGKQGIHACLWKTS